MSARRLLLVLAALSAAGCGSGAHAAVTLPAKPRAPLTANETARSLLCVDVGEDVCLSTCADEAPSRDHADCLLELRLKSDPKALELARALYARSRTIVGVEARTSIGGYRGEEVPVVPALPIGKHRHHLEWLSTSIDSFDSFLGSLRPHASKAVSFRLRPNAFVFFRTPGARYPSAYTWQGTIGYNLDGPLHTNARDARETLFHELFHLNDEQRDAWSSRSLGPLFESIVARCDGAEHHDCFTPFAPHDTVVADGTYYAFDARTRDVREYAAELALRYFLEHETVLAGGEPLAPFKCRAEENLVAWERLTDEFFGGADLTPSCVD
jgi:hypothetical protein